jgi:hypothetical protein
LTVRIFTPENRLRQVLSETHGETAEDLSAAADAQIEKLGGALRQVVRDQITRLVQLRADGDAALMARCKELTDIAMAIAEVAGVAGRPQLGEAARGVLAMTDSFAVAGTWHANALNVHLAALVLLASDPPPAPQDGDDILRQLAGMRGFVGVGEDTG